MELPLLALAAAIVAAALILSRRRAPERRSILSEPEMTRALVESVQRLERVMAGSYSKGKLGENLLQAALSQFPPEMIARDARIGGRVVEFALRMPTGKLLAIDSKWPGGFPISGADSASSERDMAKIESLVEQKIKEVAGYIDSSVTLPMAVIALPDAVFECCRKVHAKAARVGVTLISYSLALPYLLSIWNMERAYGGDHEFARMSECLHQATASLMTMSDRIEGKLSRAMTTAANSVVEIRALLASARAALAALSLTEATAGFVREDVALPLANSPFEEGQVG